MDRRAPTPPKRPTPRPVSATDDVRWLLISGAGFVVSLAALAVFSWIYHLTGPHPQVRLMIKTLHHFANWLLPGV